MAFFAPYRVDTQPWRVIFDLTLIILKVRVEHLGGIGQWPGRQRLHVEKCISGLSPLEHLNTRVDGCEWSCRLDSCEYCDHVGVFAELTILPCCMYIVGGILSKEMGLVS
jgi:hypothetical protein